MTPATVTVDLDDLERVILVARHSGPNTAGERRRRRLQPADQRVVERLEAAAATAARESVVERVRAPATRERT